MWLLRSRCTVVAIKLKLIWSPQLNFDLCQLNVLKEAKRLVVWSLDILQLHFHFLSSAYVVWSWEFNDCDDCDDCIWLECKYTLHIMCFVAHAINDTIINKLLAFKPTNIHYAIKPAIIHCNELYYHTTNTVTTKDCISLICKTFHSYSKGSRVR